MKRALAERAKQSGLPNGVGPSAPAPEKPLPRPPTTSTTTTTTTTTSSLSSNNIVDSMSSPRTVKSESAPYVAPSAKPISIHAKRNGPAPNSASSPRTGASPRPKKRLRESVVKLEEEDEDDSNAAAFYLRHQNRALASELRQLKYQIGRLERERDVRRHQCGQATQSLNALQATWTQLEAALQTGQEASNNTTTSSTSNLSTASAPLSTGSGTSVELVGALLDSLATLGSTGQARRLRKSGEAMDVDEDDSSTSSANGQIHHTGEEGASAMDPTDSEQLDDLLRISDNVSKRATALQSWIWTLLQRLEGSSSSTPDTTAAEEAHQAQQQVAHLKAKGKTLKAQLKELGRSRDELAASDKRVRRGLYRLAAGRSQLKEVLKAIVSSDEDKEAATAWMEVTPLPPSSSTAATSNNTATPTSTVKSEGGDDKESSFTTAEVAQLKKKISDLEQVTEARDKNIKSLLAEKEEQTKKINSLVLTTDDKSTNIPSEGEVKRSDLYANVTVKLSTAEQTVKALKDRENRLKEEWARALATAESAQKSVEELHAKHLKRWNDMVEEYPDVANGGDEAAETGGNISKAEDIVILEHKLTQALENVRQAEDTRKTLQEAVVMNESLQSKLEEIKTKYTTLQQSRTNNSGSTQGSATSAANGDEISTPKPKASSSEKIERPEKGDKSDKLYREYRKVQKLLAAATTSKEAAKAKVERAEKDRDSLSSSNARLLRQAAEKDEMNAKSLSTILHLKQVTDQVTKEKENLEQQVKSSQQLALAARLAANARERLSEEMEKERKSMEARVKEWEDKCQSLSQEKAQIESKMLQHKAMMSGLLKEVDKAKGRCEELSTEATKLQEAKQKTIESLAIAQKDAIDATEMTERLSKASGGAIVEGFTAEQLYTQVKHLKSRMICPVCGVRDKKCILLRCRHMFCKNCVDENIKNRSRKCPACGIRFDTKDVGDIWL